jgi:hypothetical protein
MEWIDIKEYEPRLGQTCLVVEQGFGIHGNYYYGFYVATFVRNPIHPRKGQPVFVHQLQTNERSPWVYDDVTHWMPLPDLPKQPDKETYMATRWGKDRKDL